MLPLIAFKTSQFRLKPKVPFSCQNLAMSKTIPLAVRKFYETAPEPHRSTMLEMRKRILEVVPNAEEVVSYGMPAFKVNGEVIAGLLSNKKHVGYYPFSGSILHLFPKELAGYSITKSAIHIPIAKPIPKVLVRKLIRARIAQIAGIS